jgi:ribose transport system substrate-binding protein
MLKKWTTLLGLVLLSVWIVGCEKHASSALKIAMVPKGATHEFWQAVHKGADKAAGELGVEIEWKGPIKENDRAQQIDIVEQFVSSDVNALAVAPLDDAALVKPVQEADAKKIPVVIFDSALKGEVGKDFVTFVATDNEQGGRLGGETMVKLLGGKGKVVLLRYSEGSASTTAREEGFLKVMEATPGIEVISKDQYAGVTSDEAYKRSTNMIDVLKRADGVFCPNESATAGMILTLRDAGLNGKVKLVGFDTSPTLIDYLRKGDVDALVAQNPQKMGYETVKAAVAAIKGQAVSPRIDTGVRVITKADLDLPEVKALLGI